MFRNIKKRDKCDVKLLYKNIKLCAQARTRTIQICNLVYFLQ